MFTPQRGYVSVSGGSCESGNCEVGTSVCVRKARLMATWAFLQYHICYHGKYDEQGESILDDVHKGGIDTTLVKSAVRGSPVSALLFRLS